tara:strand:+ start:1087 stop:1551 length:465 start_codon:yes stop_codon:yes gene_type:complete
MDLCKRLYTHRRAYKRYINNNNCTYYYSFDTIQYDDHYIELIESYPCNTKAELERREGQLQRENKDNIVNKNIAGRTVAEHYIDNRDEKLKYAGQYHIDNREFRLEQMKQYREDNKELIEEKRKEKKKKLKEVIPSDNNLLQYKYEDLGLGDAV